MTFGHNSFIWTPVQVIKNAETVSGNLVFNGMWDDFTDWVDNVIPDEFTDKMSDRLKEIKSKADKVSGFVKKQYEYLTGDDDIIEVWTVDWCCSDGSRQRVLYGKYRVSDKSSVKGGPKNLNGVQWNAGDEYIKAFKEETSGVSYKQVGDGYNQVMNWSETGFLPRMYSSMSGQAKRASFTAPPFGAPFRTVEETVDGVATGNTQQVAPLTIQQLVDNFLEEADRPNCSTADQKEGCMNPAASNYDKNATCPDGSCKCGDDQAGNLKKFNQTGTECVVIQCGDANRKKNSDGSCGSSCEDGFSFKKGAYPKECVPTPVDCVVSMWSAWSECADGQQTRTRTITTQPAYGGKSCGQVKNSDYLQGSMERMPPKMSETRTCAMPTTNGNGNGTTGEGTDPNNCDQANRIKKDDDTCGDCKTNYEENEENDCVEIAEEETQEGLPVGLIMGGVALLGVAFVMMK